VGIVVVTGTVVVGTCATVVDDTGRVTGGAATGRLDVGTVVAGFGAATVVEVTVAGTVVDETEVVVLVAGGFDVVVVDATRLATVDAGAVVDSLDWSAALAVRLTARDPVGGPPVARAAAHRTANPMRPTHPRQANRARRRARDPSTASSSSVFRPT
jgi:hypothetical protein